jgi:DNA repair protein RadA/Sms
MPLKDVVLERGDRTLTGIGELDRVLGGGLVRGSLVLIGGDPGVGKSTLACRQRGRSPKVVPPVLYVTAEESAAQVKMRADRPRQSRATGCSCGRRAISAPCRPSSTPSSPAC